MKQHIHLRVTVAQSNMENWTSTEQWLLITQKPTSRTHIARRQAPYVTNNKHETERGKSEVHGGRFPLHTSHSSCSSTVRKSTFLLCFEKVYINYSVPILRFVLFWLLSVIKLINWSNCRTFYDWSYFFQGVPFSGQKGFHKTLT